LNPKDENAECDFSVELNSNKNLTRLSTSNEPNQGVLIEGTLGKLRQAAFIETTILEVEGENGVLRLNIRKNEISSPKEGTDGNPKEEQL
jgi:hypothetical protein